MAFRKKLAQAELLLGIAVLCGCSLPPLSPGQRPRMPAPGSIMWFAGGGLPPCVASDQQAEFAGAGDTGPTNFTPSHGPSCENRRKK